MNDVSEPIDYGQFAAVVFDMDGLLIDSERVVRDIWVGVAREHGYTLAPEVYLRCIGTSAAGTAEILQAHWGPHAPVLAMQQLKVERFEQFRREREIPIKPGARELLAQLKAEGVPIGLATSTGRAAALDRLQKNGLLPFFDTVACGDQVARGKPAPDVYLLAAHKLDVAPEHCLAFEDSLNGMRAAVAAEMRVVMVPDLVPPDDEARALAWKVVQHLLALTQQEL